MPLTDTAIKALKPEAKQAKHFDGHGLFLLVHPNGSKYWRLKYRFGGKEKMLALGKYPDLSLKQARLKRDEARKHLADGVDPSDLRKVQKNALHDAAGNSFEAIALEWFTKQSGVWSATHSEKVMSLLKNHALPWLGARPISAITAPELLANLRRAETRGVLESAKRTRQLCSQIFRYAIATGRAERDPCADLRGALAPAKKRHLPAITDPKAIGPFLRTIDSYSGTFPVQCALKLASLVFVRPGELSQAEWSEFDLDSALWSIPAERMKTRQPHLVPLSTQAVAILRDLHPYTGRGRYVFPSARSAKRPMSNNAINAAFRRMGIGKDEMVAHGFRAMARTILDEVLGYRVDWIEHQLAHAVKDPNGRAYNRTAHLEGRRQMMQGWADYLADSKNGA